MNKTWEFLNNIYVSDNGFWKGVKDLLFKQLHPWILYHLDYCLWVRFIIFIWYFDLLAGKAGKVSWKIIINRIQHLQFVNTSLCKKSSWTVTKARKITGILIFQIQDENLWLEAIAILQCFEEKKMVFKLVKGNKSTRCHCLSVFSANMFQIFLVHWQKSVIYCKLYYWWLWKCGTWCSSSISYVWNTVCMGW